MIKNETVLVLGAGASMPYGYPSGQGLRQMLIDPSLFRLVIDKGWYDHEDVNAFCRSFMLSGMKSIDAFLARRGNDVLGLGRRTIGEVGKHGIAIALRQNKSLDTLFQKPNLNDKELSIDRCDNWYEYLWAQLSKGITTSNLQQFASNRLTVVTFNYDLSLEHYLFTAAKNSYGLDDQETTKLLKPIGFIHLYGQLSGNPFMSDFNYEFDYKFKTNRDESRIRIDASQIQVIEEERDLADSNFPSAIRAIEWASRICFLGFGFDEINVERLELARVLEDRAEARIASSRTKLLFPKVLATSLGMENVERHGKQVQLTQKITQRIISAAAQKQYIESINDGFENYAGCKSELALRRSQILS